MKVIRSNILKMEFKIKFNKFVKNYVNHKFLEASQAMEGRYKIFAVMKSVNAIVQVQQI